jgi:hypothetical protein
MARWALRLRRVGSRGRIGWEGVEEECIVVS